MANENVLTHPFLRPGTDPEGEQERRRKALSRSTSTVLAVALHIGFFFFFVFAVHPFDMSSKPIVETFLLMPPPGNNRPQQRPINPQPVFNAAPNIEAPPLYIAKPPPIPPKDQDKTGTSGQPTDILGAVGRELACSAGSWEHLTSAERARCGFYPWRGVKLPNGSLVMIPRSMMPRLPDAPETEFSINSGADRMQSDLQKGVSSAGPGGCPIMLNTPCLQHVSPGMRDATGQN